MGGTSASPRSGIGAPVPPLSMIDLTDDDIAEFQTLYRRETGRELTDDEAHASAETLVRLVDFVLRSERR